MSENQDVGSSGFEDRIRELFADGATDRAVSASGVIHGARRRRVRHRATAAGSSLAVLGVAAGAIAFGGGHSAALSRVPSSVKPAASSSTEAAAPKTCSASVTGTVPGTTATTLDDLVFETVSGKTAGIPWAVQIHVFPDKKSHTDWQDHKLPAGSIPQAAKDAEHPGAIAQFRTPDEQGYEDLGVPGGSGGDEQYFVIGGGGGIGTGTPAKTSETQGVPNPNPYDYPAYVTSGWMGPDVDHLCAQYADRAEFVPVYRIQGADFYVFGYSAADRPQRVFGYNSAGKVVGSATATKDGPYFLLPLGADQQH
jgi:hypothetical protein